MATSINYIIRGKVTGMSGTIFGIVSGNRSNIKLTQVKCHKNLLLLVECYLLLLLPLNNMGTAAHKDFNLLDLKIRLQVGQVKLDFV